MSDQLSFELPVFKGRTVDEVEVTVAGRMRTFLSHNIADASAGGTGYLVCEYRSEGIQVTYGDDDERTWVNRLRITSAFELDEDLARPMIEDLREGVRAAIDAKSGQRRLDA